MEDEKMILKMAEAYAELDIIDRKIKMALDDLNEHNEFQVKKFLINAYRERIKLKKFLRECMKTESDIANERAL